MVVWVKQMSSFVVLTRVEDSLSKKILEQMGAYCGDTAHKCVFFVYEFTCSRKRGDGAVFHTSYKHLL